MKLTKIHLHMAPSQVKALTSAAMDGMTGSDLGKLGLTADLDHDGVAMVFDAAPIPVTTPTIGNLVQFFQYWMPEAIEVITAKRNADALRFPFTNVFPYSTTGTALTSMTVFW